MADISDKKKRFKIKASLILLLLDIIIAPIIVFIIDRFMYFNLGASTIIFEALKEPLSIYKYVFSTKQTLGIFFILQGFPLVVFMNILFPSKVNLKDTTETMRVANFELPKPVGKGQMGTSRFSTEAEQDKMFAKWVEGSPLTSGGIVMGSRMNGNKRTFIYDDDDVNTLIIGTTRSGKTRRVYLPSIYLMANSGENIFINDPKGELYTYTYPYLQEMGYTVLNIDFRNPKKSLKYNYLRYINEAVKKENYDEAVEKTWDIVSLMVGESKGEKLWNNGEASVLASAILYICFEAPSEEYKNLTNVYYLIANLCKSDENGQMKITSVFENLPLTHPSRAVFSVCEIAPERTRGSFFTSALATLRLFVDSNIADMTKTSNNEDENIDINRLGTERKVALFCSIPDEKSTRAVLSTLLIDQLYMNLVEIANKEGGRLPQRVNMLIDEFGNLPKINGFDNKLTVSLGRGVRWIIAIQGIGQLNKIYERDIAKTITSNCHDWIYLLTTDPEQSKMLSEKTGTYTVQTKSVSSSTSLNGMRTNGNVNYSSSANVTKRALLTPDEIERLQPPFALVTKGRELPSIFVLPDLSELKANECFGMGDKEHNIRITKEREDKRTSHKISEVNIWLPDTKNINIKDNPEGIDLEEEDYNYIR